MKKYTLVLVILFVFAAEGISEAQKKSSYDNNKLGKKAVANLVMALMSDNVGLRNSAIDLVRGCELDEVVDALIYTLKNEDSASVKVMAAITLYRIGNPRGTKAVFNSKLWNENEFMKKINTALLIN
jgi:HEAT repeat protein